jgi:hypothetical protein
MVERIYAEFLEGYAWPHTGCRPPLFVGERIKRGLIWAAYTLREELSDLLHPDGPR